MPNPSIDWDSDGGQLLDEFSEWYTSLDDISELPIPRPIREAHSMFQMQTSPSLARDIDEGMHVCQCVRIYDQHSHISFARIHLHALAVQVQLTLQGEERQSAAMELYEDSICIDIAQLANFEIFGGNIKGKFTKVLKSYDAWVYEVHPGHRLEFKHNELGLTPRSHSSACTQIKHMIRNSCGFLVVLFDDQRMGFVKSDNQLWRRKNRVAFVLKKAREKAKKKAERRAKHALRNKQDDHDKLSTQAKSIKRKRCESESDEDSEIDSDVDDRDPNDFNLDHGDTNHQQPRHDTDINSPKRSNTDHHRQRKHRRKTKQSKTDNDGHLQHPGPEIKANYVKLTYIKSLTITKHDVAIAPKRVKLIVTRTAKGRAQDTTRLSESPPTRKRKSVLKSTESAPSNSIFQDDIADRFSDVQDLFGEDLDDADDGVTCEQDVVDSDLPTRCPGIYCKAKVPSQPSKALYASMKNYAILKRKDRLGDAPQTLRVAMDICMAISVQDRRGSYIRIAESCGWPVLDIDFRTVPERILAMRDDLNNIFNNPTARVCESKDKDVSVVSMVFIGHAPLQKASLFLWDYFLEDLKDDSVTLKTLGKLQILHTSKTVLDARPGYYGSKAAAVIMHTLFRLFLPTTSNASISPLTVAQFTTYFLAPYIAMSLIAEDMGIFIEQGYEEMIASNEVGQSLNPEEDDDEELEAIFKANLQLARMEAPTMQAPARQAAVSENDRLAADMLLQISREKPVRRSPQATPGHPAPEDTTIVKNHQTQLRRFYNLLLKRHIPEPTNASSGTRITRSKARREDNA
ncbi:hypothetical protein BJ138DRAFT_1105781 [Hygrophoropsis aurantiaca]|uniref:Uncharacterized protein n=1 Tax=Hygrophoropsis aurantiaca TaxID=72124 RepID=A0ACB7ZYC5_9AGAM|nr:hypothetical protein BJ138DRAFT_1105781 [Hygrophoropsis aurantiaca]